MAEIDIFSPVKKYDVIYADPPWRYQDKKCNGACAFHYDTMKIQDIKDLPVQELAAKDCVIFMWITYPMMKEGIELMEAWGFKYKTIGFQWIKLNKKNGQKFFGLGRWTRGNTEACFIGTRGKPSRKSNKVSQIIEEVIGPHSQKPEVVRDKIRELMGTELNYIELFARQHSEGWDCWGNEVGKLDDGQLALFEQAANS